MRIGILTYHRSHNYGAYLQAYALANVLKQYFGESVEIIDYNSPTSVKMYIREIVRGKQPRIILYNLKRYLMFWKVASRLPLSKDSLVSYSMKKFDKFVSDKYDVIIVGSDEIWRLDGERGFPNAYWLPEVNGCIKVAYGVSSRFPLENVDERLKKRMNNLLSDYRFIGVRDVATKRLVDWAKGKNEAILVGDPTFVYEFPISAEMGKKILLERFHVHPEKKHIGLMVNDFQMSTEIIRKYGGHVEVVSLFNYCPGARNASNISPQEWAATIYALDGLITTYFHGMCFAIKANIPFIVVEKRAILKDCYSKSFDLLSRYGMERYYVRGENIDIVEKNVDDLVLEIISGKANRDYSKIRSKEKESFQYFLAALYSLKGQKDMGI